MEMEMQDLGPEGNALEVNNVPEIRLYRYRWVMIALYGLYSGTSFIQNSQFTIISNICESYYGIHPSTISLSQTVFMVSLIIFILPSVYLIEKFNLRFVALACSALTFIGAILKLQGIQPGSTNFYIILVAQGICALGQVFMMMVPAKLVAVWCSAEEQNRACGLSLWGGEIGLLAGTVIPILFVNHRIGVDDIQTGIFNMLITNAIVCGIVFTAILLFYRAKPEFPPSPQQVDAGEVKIDLFPAMLDLVSNIDFVLINVVFGTSCGLWTVFGILQNEIYLHYFENSLGDLGTIAAITTICGGLIGNVLIGYILDKTLKYKLVTFIVLLCTALSYAGMAACLEMRWHSASFIMIFVYGFFSSIQTNISFQYTAEVTYPTSEAVSLSLLQVTTSFVTVFYCTILAQMLEEKLFERVHLIMFFTLLIVTFATKFLSSSLKRMLVEKRR